MTGIMLVIAQVSVENNHLHDMPTEKSAGVEDVRFCSGLSASHDCMAKTTATLFQHYYDAFLLSTNDSLPANHPIKTVTGSAWPEQLELSAFICALLVPGEDLRHNISSVTIVVATTELTAAMGSVLAMVPRHGWSK